MVSGVQPKVYSYLQAPYVYLKPHETLELGIIIPIFTD